MVKYMEREFGERAMNGDRDQLSLLQAKIADLEQQLEQQKAGQNTAASDDRSDKGSENETDEDVSRQTG